MAQCMADGAGGISFSDLDLDAGVVTCPPAVTVSPNTATANKVGLIRILLAAHSTRGLGIAITLST